jgi:hypothetical protein
MPRISWLSLLVALVCVLPLLRADEPAAKRTPKEALQAVQDLVGEWRGTGEPKQGTREERMRNFWQETVNWGWRFKGDDCWLKATVAKGKYFTYFELRYLPQTDRYSLQAKTVENTTLTFEGTLEKKKLVLERADEKTKETQRLSFDLLHFNRHLYRYEVRTEGKTLFTSIWQVGATKEGVDFATLPDKPECIVSGGLGTMTVMYKGQTYYVCCTGCRDAFLDTPEKYIAEFEAKKKNKPK